MWAGIKAYWAWTGIGEFLGGAWALAAANPAIVIPACLALIAAISYYRLHSDSPIAAGPNGDVAARTAAGTVTPPRAAVSAGSNAMEKYHVYVLALSGGSIWVGQEQQRLNTPACRFSGGGNCSGHDDPPPEVIYQSPDYDTEQAAIDAWCTLKRGAKIENWPADGDSKATVYGGKYWMGTAPACPG